MKKIVVSALFVMFLVVPMSAFGAGDPMKSLQEPIDEVINLLKDPQYKDEAGKKVQREKIWEIIQQVFDFDRISKLALGKYRKKFNESQLKNFTDVFARLLEKNYLKKIQAEYKNEKVNYLDQKVKKDKALVATEIIREKVKIPVDYLMWLNNDLWRIYDVKVEKVSLVKNYRSQFQKLLGDESKSPSEVTEQVRKKVEAQKN